MSSARPSAHSASETGSELWRQWQRILRRHPQKPLLIEAETGIVWTAQQLNDEALRLSSLLPTERAGTRVAFCLPNGPAWMALFLALQQRGYAAIPLDAALPEAACMEKAQYLHCRALYFHSHLHLLENARRDLTAICCHKVTSGTSSGHPTTVPCRASHLLADGAQIIRTMGIRAADRNLATIPLGHSYGLGNFVLPLIQQGTSLVCARHFVPRQIIEWIDRYHVTVLPSVPAIFRVLAHLPGEQRPASLRLVISAGAPLTAEVARAFSTRYGVRIHNFYGSSETGGITYDRTGTATLTGRSLGKPMAGVTLTIQRGVLTVASPAVAKRSGKWRVPDRGEWNSRGELVYLGRRGKVVNLGGKKMQPSEVDHVLRGLPGVTDATVWAAPHAGRLVLEAAVETHLSQAELHRALAARLPEWKLPRHFLLLPELPRTARGKLDVALLRKKIGTSH
jgi:acyl-coenzyme A synthetase/AMP-(fatty) acid ligase